MASERASEGAAADDDRSGEGACAGPLSWLGALACPPADGKLCQRVRDHSSAAPLTGSAAAGLRRVDRRSSGQEANASHGMLPCASLRSRSMGSESYLAQATEGPAAADQPSSPLAAAASSERPVARLLGGGLGRVARRVRAAPEPATSNVGRDEPASPKAPSERL